MGYAFGTRWDDDLIKEKVIYVMNELKINVFPTSKQMNEVIGNASLSNAIKRRMGNRKLAENMGIEIGTSCTSIGQDQEFKVKDFLENIGYKVEKMTTKYPYDLLINDCLKVDVKTSKLHKNYYSFNLEKLKPTCDMYILVENDTQNMYFVPSKFLNQTQVSISNNSKYDRFKFKTEYIDKYIDFYNSIA